MSGDTDTRHDIYERSGGRRPGLAGRDHRQRIIYQVTEAEQTVRVVAIRHRSLAYRSDLR